MSVPEFINRTLDRVAEPQVRFGARACTAFQAWGYTGYALSIALSMSIVASRGLSLWIMAGIIGCASLTFLLLAMITKIAGGKERLVYYHHQIAVLTTAALLLKLLGQPLLPYLDATVLGVGLFLVCGRMGCLMAGCCHGRPSRWGVRYKPEHVAAGFPAYLLRVRLLPVQGFESLWVLMVVVIGVIMEMQGSAWGSALAWYVVMYSAGRFTLEFLRADAERPYWAGFSEGQWTSLALLMGVAVVESLGLIPVRFWQVSAAPVLTLAMLAIFLIRRFRPIPQHQLLLARHIREFSQAVDLVSRSSTEGSPNTGSPPTIQIAHTSLGIRISSSQAGWGSGVLRHFTLSGSPEPISSQAVACLAQLIIRLRYPHACAEVVPAAQGVSHILIREGQPRQSRMGSKK